MINAVDIDAWRSGLTAQWRPLKLWREGEVVENEEPHDVYRGEKYLYSELLFSWRSSLRDEGAWVVVTGILGRTCGPCSVDKGAKTVRDIDYLRVFVGLVGNGFAQFRTRMLQVVGEHCSGRQADYVVY